MSPADPRARTYHGRDCLMAPIMWRLEHDQMLDKYLLFTSGPVNVARTVRAAICKEDIKEKTDQIPQIKPNGKIYLSN